MLFTEMNRLKANKTAKGKAISEYFKKKSAADPQEGIYKQCDGNNCEDNWIKFICNNRTHWFDERTGHFDGGRQ